MVRVKLRFYIDLDANMIYNIRSCFRNVLKNDSNNCDNSLLCSDILPRWGWVTSADVYANTNTNNIADDYANASADAYANASANSISNSSWL